MQLDPEGHEVAALAEAAPDLAGARILEVGCGAGRLTRRTVRQAPVGLRCCRNAPFTSAARTPTVTRLP